MRKLMLALMSGLLIATWAIPAMSASPTTQTARVTLHVRTNQKGSTPVPNAEVDIVYAGRTVRSVTVDASGDAVVSVPASTQLDSDGVEQYQLFNLVVQASGFQTTTMTNIPAAFDNPITVDIPMNRGTGDIRYENPRTKLRPGIKHKSQPDKTNPPALPSTSSPNVAAVVSPQSTCTDWYQSTYTLTKPDPAVENYVWENTQSLIMQSLTREFDGLTPVGTWEPEALKAGSIAIRSWLLYWTEYTSKGPTRKHGTDTFVENSTADLTWYTYYSTAAQDATNAVPYKYMQYGSLSDGTCKPATTYFSGIVASQEPEYGAGWSKDQRYDDEYKPYLASAYDEADFTNNLGSSYATVQYIPAPGLSQQGANTWAHGFTDHTGASHLRQTYDWILYHYYSTIPTIRIAQHY